LAWQVVLTKQAAKDAQNLVNAKLWSNTERLLEVLAINPFQNPLPYEKLVDNLASFYSRRINIQHRLVYQVLKETNTVKVIRIWSH
jgi:toxin YoeB